MVTANMVWLAIFACLLRHLFDLQELGGCNILMHPHTHSVQCTFVGAKEEVDVFCVCGTCGTKRGMWKWVQADLESIRGWPTLGSKSRSQFKSCTTHWNALKVGKGKRAAIPTPNPNPNPGSIRSVPASEGEDNAPSFQGPDLPAMEQRVQPAQTAKLMHIRIVDSDIEHQLAAHGSSSSNSNGSSSNESSGESPSGVDSDNGGHYMSGGSTVSANGCYPSFSSVGSTKVPS